MKQTPEQIYWEHRKEYRWTASAAWRIAHHPDGPLAGREAEWRKFYTAVMNNPAVVEANVAFAKAFFEPSPLLWLLGKNIVPHGPE